MDEFAPSVIEDLRYLRTTWDAADALDDNFLRRDSAVLRRLLIDGGNGLLPKVRREMGLGGTIRLTAIDLLEHIQGLDTRLIEFASAGGATHNGVAVMGGLLYKAAMADDQVKQRYEQGVALREFRLNKYLDSPCLVIAGTRVRRRDVIQYIANKKGGVHYDESRDRARDESFRTLDGFMGTTQLADKDAVYFELLSIGQALVTSPQVAVMLEPPPD